MERQKEAITYALSMSSVLAGSAMLAIASSHKVRSLVLELCRDCEETIVFGGRRECENMSGVWSSLYAETDSGIS